MYPKKWKSPQTINQIVDNLLKKWKVKSSQKDLAMNTLWVKIVGQQVAGHTKVVQISHGKLVIAAENSAWMNELTFMKEMIKIKAKSIFLEHGINVDDVNFRLGKGKNE